MIKKLLISILVPIILLAGVYFYINYKIYTPLSSDEAERIFIIEKGDTVKEISRSLEEEGLINSSFYFETYIYYKKLGSKLQAGIYSLNSSMSIPEIVDWFIEGKANQVKVTIPEGWRATQITERLNEKDIVSKEEFLKALDTIDKSTYEEYNFLNQIPKGQDLEGFLFPDTYIFYKESKSEDVVDKMLANFDVKLDKDLREEIDKQDKTIFEIVTLASIIEREAKTPDEMPKIASVYWNRLEIDMKLDADPTIQYAKGNWDKLELGDYKNIISSYNTYLNKGLPPSPICNPGFFAIKAAIYPENTDYFYFFHTEDGKTYFSETKEEHDENKAKYLR